MINPVFERDFLGFVVRKRFFALRAGVVGAVAAAIIVCAFATTGHNAPDAVGRALFLIGAIALACLALLVTPSMVLPVVMDERKRATLDLLRSSPLSPARIVIGLWGSRVGVQLALCLAAFSTLSMSLTLGGVPIVQYARLALFIVASVMWVSALAVWVGMTARDLIAALGLTLLTVVCICAILASGNLVAVTFGASPAAAGFTLPWYAALSPIDVLRGALGDGVLIAPLGGMDHAVLHAGLCFAATGLLLWRSTHLLATSESLSGEVRAKERRALERRYATHTNAYPRRFFTHKLITNPMLWLEFNFGGLVRPWWTRLGVWIGLVVVELGVHVFAGMSNWIVVHLLAALALLIVAACVVITAGAATYHRERNAANQAVLLSAPAIDEWVVMARIAVTRWQGLPLLGLALVHVVEALLGLGGGASFVIFAAVMAFLVTIGVLPTFFSAISLRFYAIIANYISIRTKNASAAVGWALGGFLLIAVVLPCFVLAMTFFADEAFANLLPIFCLLNPLFGWVYGCFALTLERAIWMLMMECLGVISYAIVASELQGRILRHWLALREEGAVA